MDILEKLAIDKFDRQVVLNQKEWDSYFMEVLPEIKNEYKQGNQVLYYKGLPVICKDE